MFCADRLLDSSEWWGKVTMTPITSMITHPASVIPTETGGIEIREESHTDCR